MQHQHRMFLKGCGMTLKLAILVVSLSAAGFCGDTLSTNQSLSEGQSLVSANGAYKATYQTDGNFVVYSGNSNAINRRAIQGNVAASDWLIGPYQNSYQAFNGFFITDGAVVAGAFKVSSFVAIAAGNGSFWVQGSLIGSTNTPVHVPGTIGLGISGTTAEPLDGDIAEVLGYTADMTAQRLLVENYLRAKYNI